MVSRNIVKIEQKLAEIRDLYPSIKTEGVEADFSKLSTLAEYNKLAEKLSHLDIAILCLNAGVSMLATIDDLSD